MNVLVMRNSFDAIKAISVNVKLYFDVDAIFRPGDFDVLFFSPLLLTIFKISHPLNNVAESDIKIYFFFLFTKRTLL